MSTSLPDSKRATTNQPRVGDMLRNTRLARGLTLDDVSAELKIARSDLECLEAMYASGLKRGYLNPQLRSYSSFLGLPPDVMILQFAEQCGAVTPRRETTKPEQTTAPTRSRMLVRAAAAGVAAVGVLAGTVFVALNLTRGAPEDAAVLVDAAPLNGARQSLLDTVGVEGLEPQLPLSLVALQDSWIEVRGEDGTKYRERVMNAGEIYFPRIGAGWTVSARNGAAFEWQLDGVPVGPLSDTAAPVYALSVDTVAARAQETGRPAMAGFSEARPTR